MNDENPDNLPLVERVNKAEFLARELSEHLKQAYLPKLAQLRSSSKRLDPEEVSDQTMFDQMSVVVNAEEFASDLCTRLMKYLQSIQKDAKTVLGVDTRLSSVPERDSQANVKVDIHDIVAKEGL
jgi:hypothetical protein